MAFTFLQAEWRKLLMVNYAIDSRLLAPFLPANTELDTWNAMKVTTGDKLQPIPVGSEAEFITEHYWGYTKIAENKTSEYAVEHPRWEMYETINFEINVNFTDIYGDLFAFLNNQAPKSVFLAEGSPIKVKSGRTF